MRVYVNDLPLTIFRGCRARDAVLRFLKKTGQAPSPGSILLRDRWGNEISDDSPMSEDGRVYFEDGTASGDGASQEAQPLGSLTVKQAPLSEKDFE